MQVQGLKLNKLSFDEISASDKVYEFGLLNMLSEVILKKEAKVTEIDWEEFVEAYLFDENCELHILREGDTIYAIEAVDDGTGSVVTKKYEIALKFSKTGSRLLVNEYMGKDEDGQNFVAYKRLKGVE